MSVARKPVPRTDMYFTSVVIANDGPFPVGTAVAIVGQGNQLVYRPAGARKIDGVGSFAGFLHGTYDPGMAPNVTTVRGALVTPVVEHGVPLVSGQPVYLSLTPGEVTQILPLDQDSQILPLGFAVNATQFVLALDARIESP